MPDKVQQRKLDTAFYGKITYILTGVEWRIGFKQMQELS